MIKTIKMVLYGEPGVGKSVFASHSPNPFFICTDDNYVWLTEFGAKEENHVNVTNWEEAKKAFRMDFSKYDTIILDLTEDSFGWCVSALCEKHGKEHISEVGNYGKGYDISRTEFIDEIFALLNQRKNVILIMHGATVVTKDRRGNDIYKYVPSPRIPEKVLDAIEGRVRYFLRAYTKAVEVGNKLIKKRFLSLVPKENEYGIIRGVNEDEIPTDIDLDWNAFVETLGLDLTGEKASMQISVPEKPAGTSKESMPAETEPAADRNRMRRKTPVAKTEESKVMNVPTDENMPNADSSAEPEKAEPAKNDEPVKKAEAKMEENPVTENPSAPQNVERPKTNQEKLDNLLAKLNNRTKK